MPLRGLDDVDTFPQWTLELLFSDSKDGIKICLYPMPTPQCSRASVLTTIFFDGRLSKTISNSLRPSKTQPPTSRSFCSTISNEPQLKRHTPPTQRLFPCTRYSIPKYWIDPIILGDTVPTGEVIPPILRALIPEMDGGFPVSNGSNIGRVRCNSGTYVPQVCAISNVSV
jgi:hypothetical protein